MDLTSSRAGEEWCPLLCPDELMAAAAMDRLLDRAHMVEVDGHSLRHQPPGRRASGAGRPRRVDQIEAHWSRVVSKGVTAVLQIARYRFI